MKLKILFTIAAILFCCGSCFSAPTNAIATDLNHLIARVNAKLMKGKTKEADLAPELRQYDVLYAKYKNKQPEQSVEILLAKVNLYLQVFDDPDKAIAILRQIKHDAPWVQINGNTDTAIAMIQKHANAKRIFASLTVGSKFPDFNVIDTAGKPLSIAKYKGKVVLVDFWATWCVYCLLELPNVNTAYKKYHSSGFEVIGISLDDDKTRFNTFLRDGHFPWPQYFDGHRFDNKLAMKYGIEGIPATFLIDRNGFIIGKDLKGKDLEAAVVKALAKK